MGLESLLGGGVGSSSGWGSSGSSNFALGGSNGSAWEMMQAAMNYNAQQAKVNRDWQEHMSNTAYQRAVKDMKAAGINPILAAGNGGAQVGSGGAATVSGGVDTSSYSQGNSGSAWGSMSETLPYTGYLVRGMADAASTILNGTAAGKIAGAGGKALETGKQLLETIHDTAGAIQKFFKDGEERSYSFHGPGT